MNNITFYELNRYLSKFSKALDPLKKIKKFLMYLPIIYGVLSLFLYCKNNNIQLMDIINIKTMLTIGIISIVSTTLIIFYVGLCFSLALKNEYIFNKNNPQKKTDGIAKVLIYSCTSLCFYLFSIEGLEATPAVIIIISFIILPFFITLRLTSHISLLKIMLFMSSTLMISITFFTILFSIILTFTNKNDSNLHNIILFYGIIFLIIMYIMTFFHDILNSSIVLCIIGLMLLTPIILQSSFQIKLSGLGNEYRCYLTNEINALSVPEKFTMPQPLNVSKIFIVIKTADVMYIKKEQDGKEFARLTTIPKVEFSCTE